MNALITVNLNNILHPNSLASMQDAARRWGCRFVELTEPFAAAAHPNWQKAFVAEWAAGRDYERVVYVDADVLIRSDAPNIFDVVPRGKLGAVRHKDGYGRARFSTRRNKYAADLSYWSERVSLVAGQARLPTTRGGRCPVDQHLNAGVLVFEPAAHQEIFARWIELGRTVGFERPPGCGLRDEAALSALLHCRHPGALHALERTWNAQCQNAPENKPGPMQFYVQHYCGRDGKAHLPGHEWQVRPWSVDRVVCLNLDRRPDRWEAFLAGLPAGFPAGVERFAAIDGATTTPPAWFTYPPGAWGCYLSHLEIWRQAIERDESVLVLEDDAVFCADFAARMQAFVADVPPTWGLVYFGGRHASPPRPLTPRLSRARRVIGTHAYAVRGATLRALYKWCRRPGREIDQRMAAFTARGLHAAYCPPAPLIGQRDGYSDIFNESRDLANTRQFG